MKIQQIKPAGCTGWVGLPGIFYLGDGKYEVQGHVGNEFLSEVKFDGHRALLHLGSELPKGYLTSRRISKVTEEYKENGSNVPQFVQANQSKALAAGMGYTVLDGEVIVPDHPFEAVQTVMGSHPLKALEWQAENAYAVFIVMDILFHNGVDVRHRKQIERTRVAQLVTRALACNTMDIAVAVLSADPAVHMERFYEVLKQDGEGLVIKDPNAPYGRGWKKWKKEETYDMVITGFTEGNNKYCGMFGAIEFGAFIQQDEGLLLKHMGKCSGLEDGVCVYENEHGSQVDPNSEGCILVPVSVVEQPVGSRAWFHLNRDDIIGKVIEVKCNGLTKHGKLRHPQFFRMRPDKPASECLVPKQQE